MIYLVSYPKSGRTYLRYMIGKYFQLKHNLNEIDILDYSIYAKAYNCNDGLCFTHSTFYEDNVRIPFDNLHMKKTIWLKRNPYDTLVSFYHHVKYRKKQTEFSISEFIRSLRFGVAPYIVFKSQCDLLDNLLVIDYEDLVDTPELFLYAILKILGETPDPDLLFKSIQLSSFDNMRKAEVSGSVNMSERSYIDKEDTRQLKTRVGLVNNYKKYLSDEDIEYIDEELHHYNKWEQSIANRVTEVLRFN